MRSVERLATGYLCMQEERNRHPLISIACARRHGSVGRDGTGREGGDRSGGWWRVGGDKLETMVPAAGAISERPIVENSST